MDHDGIQGIDEWFSSRLRHVCAKVQIFRILHKLKRDQEDSEMILRVFRKQPEKTLPPNTG